MTAYETSDLTIPAGIIDDLCLRNHPAELQFTDDQANHFQAKVRFLHCRGDAFLIDQPRSEGKPLPVRPGHRVMLFFACAQQRLALQTSVLQRTTWNLHGQGQVPTLELTVPTEIFPAQRRRAYRLSMLQHTRMSVQVSRCTQDGGVPDEQPVECVMYNISESGCGLLFHKDYERLFKNIARFRVRFTLPNMETPLNLLANVRHRHRVSLSDRLMVGLEWSLDEDDPDDREIKDLLGRYIITAQIDTLRQMRQEE